MPATIGLSQIGQVTNVVHDIDRAVKFYRDSLGIPFLFQAPPNLAFFQCGAIRLMLSPPENPEQDHPGSFLYFSVKDIGAVYEALKGRGVKFVDQPHRVHATPEYELWMTFFHDLDKNPMALMEQKPK